MMDHEKLFLIKISIQQLKMKKSLRKIKHESWYIFSHYSYFNRLFSNYWTKKIELIGIEIDNNSLLEEFKIKKKNEKSDIITKGRVGWTPKPYL